MASSKQISILCKTLGLGTAFLLASCDKLQEPVDVASTPTSEEAPAPTSSKKSMAPIVTKTPAEKMKSAAYKDMSADDLALLAEQHYYGSRSTKKDIAKALDLFRQAAEKGSGYACRRLGLEYSDFAFDDLTPRDDEVARNWFEMGAKLGDAESVFYLSEFVYNGRGGPKDEQRGTELLLKAARLSSQKAAHRAVKLDRKGSLLLSQEDKIQFYALDKDLRKNVTALLDRKH